MRGGLPSVLQTGLCNLASVSVSVINVVMSILSTHANVVIFCFNRWYLIFVYQELVLGALGQYHSSCTRAISQFSSLTMYSSLLHKNILQLTLVLLYSEFLAIALVNIRIFLSQITAKEAFSSSNACEAYAQGY